MLKARHSGKCLEVYHSSFSSGANVDQWTCNGTATQHWYVYLVGYSGSSNIYEIVNVNSNLCLNVAGGSTADGANVEQHTCGTAAAPLWVGPATITNAYLKNYSTGKYLEVHGASKADGANVDQWHYVSGASNEQWTRA